MLALTPPSAAVWQGLPRGPPGRQVLVWLKLPLVWALEVRAAPTTAQDLSSCHALLLIMQQGQPGAPVRRGH